MYNFCRIIFGIIFTVFFRWQIKGVENIPKNGGVIIAANHISLWDPPVVGSALPRKLHFMAKEELFSNQILRWIITKLGAFPVRRGTADRTAIRKAIAILQEGGMLGLFPEGTRSKDGKLGQAESGLAMIAIRAGVPIVPAAIIGTNKVFQAPFFPRFRVIFGEPIYPDKIQSGRGLSDEISKKVMDNIANLMHKES